MKHSIEFMWGILMVVLLITAVFAITGCGTVCTVNDRLMGVC